MSSGLAVRKPKPRRILRSSSLNSTARIGVPASSSTLQPLQHDRLALVRLALGAARLADRRLDRLQALLDDPEVGEGKFEVDRLDVAQRIDRSSGCGTFGSSKARTTWTSACGLREVAEQLPAQPLLGHPLRQPGDIDILHIGRDDLLRLEDARQHVKARIRHLHGRQVRLILGGGVGADAASARVRALKTVVLPLLGRPTITRRRDKGTSRTADCRLLKSMLRVINSHRRGSMGDWVAGVNDEHGMPVRTG